MGQYTANYWLGSRLSHTAFAHSTHRKGDGMPNRIVGLDISSHRLLAVEVQGATTKKPSLERVHAIALEAGAARDSEVLDMPAVSQALRQLWKEGEFKSKRVVLGVGNQRVLVRDHTVPLIPLSQLRQSLPYQVADLLPVPVNETILDFYPISEVEGSDPPEMHGLLVAAIKENVETNVATVEDAGLKVVGVDLSPFALVRALAGAGQASGCRTFAMIGDRTTYIVVATDGVPQFVRIVPAGGDTITEAVQEATGLDLLAAHRLKTQIGIDQGAQPEYAAPADAMLGALRRIIGSIRSTNSYYLSNHAGTAIEEVIVLGRDSQVPGLVRAIGEHLVLPTRVGAPLADLAVNKDLDPEKLTHFEPELAIALGLALGNR